MPIIGILASAITGNLGLSVDYLVVAGGALAVAGEVVVGGGGARRITLNSNCNWWRWKFRNSFNFSIKYFIIP
jgi:hypothetical protein